MGLEIRYVGPSPVKMLVGLALGFACAAGGYQYAKSEQCAPAKAVPVIAPVQK